jgi:DNA-directed RNA polymerase specialized sigma24 family protein
MSEDRDMLARRLLQNYDAARDDLACLTDAQREALTLAAKGYAYKDIAALLGVSRSAVLKRLELATSKLNRNMAECIALAAVAGWV